MDFGLAVWRIGLKRRPGLRRKFKKPTSSPTKRPCKFYLAVNHSFVWFDVRGARSNHRCPFFYWLWLLHIAIYILTERFNLYKLFLETYYLAPLYFS